MTERAIIAETPELPLERLEAEITELAGHLWAATCRWLLLVAEFDRREGWASWGCKSCAHWLSWRCGVALGPAREKVRVARRLQELPLISEAFARGELSYSKVRALSRVANSENEAELVGLARTATTAQLERLMRAYRRALAADEVEEVNRRHAERYLRCSCDEDGSLVISGRLSPEDGALVTAALDLATKDVSAETRSLAIKNADALVAMAETVLASGTAARQGGERNQVNVHVDAGALAKDDVNGRCELEDGPALAPETARRLGCDASVVPIIKDSEAEPLSVGRKTRTIPPAMRRALKSRDGGCRFPSCTERRFVDGRHIRHWAHGGETSLTNLLLLCRRHHRLVHEGGFGLHSDSHGRFVFTGPDGQSIPDAPLTAPSQDDVRQLNCQKGLRIGPHTTVPLWGGEQIDYGLGVDGLLGLRAQR